MRGTVVVLHDTKKAAIHFCDTPLREGDKWFEFSGDNDDLFIVIEDLMVGSGIANNVTSVQYLRKSGVTLEYTVVYNEALTPIK